MKMANFLMRKNTPVAEVTDGTHLSADVTRVGAVDVQRGAIGDIAATDDGMVVVTNHSDDTVSLLRADTLAVAGVVAVPGEPFAVVVADGRAYVSTTSSSCDAISVIDTVTQTVVATYSLAFSVTALAPSPDGKRVYAGRTGDGYVDVVVVDTTAERVGTIDIATGAGIGIDAVQVDPTGKRLYVATTDDRGSALVVVDVETARVRRTVSVGSPIRDIAIADDVAYVLTSDRTSGGAVKVIDLSKGRDHRYRRTRNRRPDTDDRQRRQDPCIHRRLRQRHGAVHAHAEDRQHGEGRRPAVMCRSRFRRRPAVRGRLCGRGDAVVGRVGQAAAVLAVRGDQSDLRAPGC